jgi:predicted kinase
MQIFDKLCPAGPEWKVDWERIEAAFGWVRRLGGVPQDAVHHAEGDVLTHTRMAVQALAGLDQWRALPADRRVRLFATVLLHDVAKPYCTQHTEQGRITAHGHSRKGDLLARQILWEQGVSVADREHVCALVRHHQVPFWALERQDLERIVLQVSLNASNVDLALLATADILGRICSDAEEVLENIGLFQEYCADLGVLDEPWPFASDHSRFMYFRTPGRDPRYAAYDDTRGTMTVLSGLPGAGKDTWAAAHAEGQPVVSLDAIRARLGISPAGDQRAVASAAHEEAKKHLRAGQSFVWNATNISRQHRDICTGLAASYRARVRMISFEAPYDLLLSRNAARPAPVPSAVIARLAAKWEAPSITEAHELLTLTT